MLSCIRGETEPGFLEAESFVQEILSDVVNYEAFSWASHRAKGILGEDNRMNRETGEDGKSRRFDE